MLHSTTTTFWKRILYFLLHFIYLTRLVALKVHIINTNVKGNELSQLFDYGLINLILSSLCPDVTSKVCSH